jgi:hypothetical protein
VKYELGFYIPEVAIYQGAFFKTKASDQQISRFTSGHELPENTRLFLLLHSDHAGNTAPPFFSVASLTLAAVT